MATTLLTHFFNEELLLPYWLRHHRELFDHGVLVDRGSTDRSREVIRELVPDWEVVPSRNPLFDARDTDMEMMDLERRYEGWKMVLNVTEFLVHDDLEGHLARVEPEVRTLAVECRTMADPPALVGAPLDDRPLVIQRHHHVPRDKSVVTRRFIHREPDGAYAPGRHAVRHPFAEDGELVVFKYLWSPWPQVKQRRLRIAQGIPDADVRLSLGWALLFTEDELDEQFVHHSRMARDVREDHRIARALERLARGPRGRSPKPVARRDPSGTGRRVAVITDRAGASCLPGLADALAHPHDAQIVTLGEDRAVTAVTSADVVLADARSAGRHPVTATVTPLLVDLTGEEPWAPDERLLLLGDLFLWDEGRHDAWLARFAELGRLPAEPREHPERVRLLGAPVSLAGPDDGVRAAVAGFVARPRRTTARAAQDEPLPVSRIAYARRSEAAVSWMAQGAMQAMDLGHENNRLRAEIERLTDELERVHAAVPPLHDELRRLHAEVARLNAEVARLTAEQRGAATA